VARIFNLEIKELEPSEMPAAVRVFLTAFSRPPDSLEKRVIQLWTGLREHQVTYFQIARHKQSIVGVGGICPYNSLAFIGWMATDPAFRRRGIANALFKSLLNYAEEAEIPSLALFATEVGEKLYTKWGFEAQYHVATYEILGSSNNVNQDLYPKRIEALPRWILKMDKAAFGGDRSRLLQFLFEKGQLIVSGEHGFGFVVNDTLGPIIANDSVAAVEIVRHAYERCGAKRMHILQHNELPRYFLSNIRLNPMDSPPCLRMVFGEAVDEDITKRYAAFSYATS
jgi:N-acetylglutamate synthase-like GNAT family acetyltransferase